MKYDEIGKKICELRKARGLTAEKLAELLGVSPQAVSKWENGRNLPETANLPLLASVLNCSVDCILLTSELKIISAFYTDGMKKIDVTGRISALVNDDKLNFVVDGESLCADIESERPKVLILKYRIPSGTYLTYALENEAFGLDGNSVNEKADGTFKIMGAYYGNGSDLSDVKGKIRHYEFFNWKEIPVNHRYFPSSTAADGTEYLMLVYRDNSGVNAVSCEEGKCLRRLGNDRGFEVVDERSEKRILPGIIPLNWGEGRDCTWAGAVYALMKYMGEDFSYEYIMGVSGYCYRISFLPAWDFSSVDVLNSFDTREDSIRRLGYECSWVESGSKTGRKNERDMIMESINNGMPLIALNLRIAPEWGVITGYSENGRKLLCRTYFDAEIFGGHENEPDFALSDGGYLEADSWPSGMLKLRKKKYAQDAATGFMQSLRILTETWNVSHNGAYFTGSEAYAAWAKALADDKFFVSLDETELKRVLSVNDYQLMNLIDARRSAAVYIRCSAHLFEAELAATVNSLADIYCEASLKLAEFREQMRKSGNMELRYNSTSSSGTADAKMRKEQSTLLSEIRTLEEKAVKTATRILGIAGSM